MVCDGPLPSLYVFHWTQSVLDDIKARGSGTTFPEISKTAFRPIPVLVPPRPVLDACNGVVDPMFALVKALAIESTQLAEIRDLLLPKLLSGEVRVRSTDTVVVGST